MMMLLPCGFLRSQCQSRPPSSSEGCRTHSVGFQCGDNHDGDGDIMTMKVLYTFSVGLRCL